MARQECWADLFKTRSDSESHIDEHWLHVFVIEHLYNLRQPTHRLQCDVIIHILSVVHASHHGGQHGGGELVHLRYVTAGDVSETAHAVLADEKILINKLVEKRVDERFSAAPTLHLDQLNENAQHLH